MRRISKKAFAAWLREHQSNEFQVRNSRGCPLSTFSGKEALGPEGLAWQERFAVAVDGTDGNKITGAAALRILEKL